jgi:hypothetical protein
MAIKPKEKFTPDPYDPYLKNVRALIATRAEQVVATGTSTAQQPDMMSAMKEKLKNAKATKAKAGK